ncbi:unnamed protein product [Macrosiphum euphorbiae]|uniref:Uncharacterized protein n=1 Tax=Macrosiphum euphorbiae TaxID=13131 RepID=A0AAV0VX85_9HEMI|nr:unnamed protein product [Macrosiphum euphorbiae]
MFALLGGFGENKQPAAHILAYCNVTPPTCGGYVGRCVPLWWKILGSRTYRSFETTARVRPSTMRFLWVCVAVLSGLVAVGRCFVFTPEPMKAAANILRGVLAYDREWQTILTQQLDPGEVDFEGKLDELDLTPAPGTGITPHTIIQRLVTRRSTTGTQLMYGIRVLGIALVNQFITTLMVHSYLASKFADRKEADPASMRVGISKIQVSLVNFASKAAFFGHPIDFFRQLNDGINEFLDENKDMLDSKKTNMIQATRTKIMDFLTTFFDATKEKITKVSHSYKNLDDTEIREIMNSLKLRGELPKVIDKKMDRHDLYNMIIYIDDYGQVNVKSVGLDFGEKRFKINKYIPKDDDPNI